MLCWTGQKEDRLRIQVYDADFSNEDDFMGGASIDLSGLLDDDKGLFIKVPMNSKVDPKDLPHLDYKSLAVDGIKAKTVLGSKSANLVDMFSGILSQVTEQEEKGKLFCRLVWCPIDS